MAEVKKHPKEDPDNVFMVAVMLGIGLLASGAYAEGGTDEELAAECFDTAEAFMKEKRLRFPAE